MNVSTDESINYIKKRKSYLSVVVSINEKNMYNGNGLVCQ